jgi:uncharacterized membrane protein HdeD (DUF308 family)
MIAAALEELVAAFAGERRRWQVVGRVVLAAVFLVIAVVSFIHPGNTFAALAAVMSFYFIVQGAVDMGVAFMSRSFARASGEDPGMWWIFFVLGAIQVLIGLWAAGDFGRRSILLVVWVGVAALSRGVNALLFAFVLRDAHSWTSAAATERRAVPAA